MITLFAIIIFSNRSNACERHETNFNNFATVSNYHSEIAKTETLAVILPATGGENFLDRQLAQNLCELGVSAVIFDYRQGTTSLLDIQGHDRVALEFFNSFRQFLEIQAKPSVVVVASLGGLYASMSFGLHLPGIEGAILTVAGGSLGEILGTSTLDLLIQQRLARQEQYHLKSSVDYVDFMKGQIKYDPIKLADPLMSQRLFMLSSSRDSAVPTKTQEQLWQAWGGPRRVIRPLNHAFSIAYYYSFYAEEMADFIVSLKISQKSN
jgi:hypothetical protein